MYHKLHTHILNFFYLKLIYIRDPINSYIFTIPVQYLNELSGSGELFSIQHYVIKLVSDLWQVGGFLQFPPLIKTDWHDITEILLKVVLNTKIPL
jgi:hypothetical protein